MLCVSQISGKNTSSHSFLEGQPRRAPERSESVAGEVSRCVWKEVSFELLDHSSRTPSPNQTACRLPSDKQLQRRHVPSGPQLGSPAMPLCRRGRGFGVSNANPVARQVCIQGGFPQARLSSGHTERGGSLASFLSSPRSGKAPPGDCCKLAQGLRLGAFWGGTRRRIWVLALRALTIFDPGS